MNLIAEFDQLRSRQWMKYVKVMADQRTSPDPRTSSKFQNARMSQPLRDCLFDRPEVIDEFKLLILTLTEYVWTDLPHDNGEGVYRTIRDKQILMRGLGLFYFLEHNPGWTIAKIIQAMGMDGGGQIAYGQLPSGDFLDRFAIAPERIEKLIQVVNEGPFPQSAIEVVSTWRRHLLMQESHELLIFTCYRWFGNPLGVLPPLHEVMMDRPVTTLMDHI